MSQTETDGPIDSSHKGWLVDVLTDPKFARDPRPYFERMRQGSPLRDELELPGRPPTIVVARSDDVDRSLRNPQLFSSRFGEGVGGLGNDRPLIPLQIDPPEHKKYRVLLDPYFAPRRMASLEGEVAKLVNELMDGFAERGSCDFTSEFAIPLPSTVFLRMCGLPLSDLDFFLGIKDGIIRANGEINIAKATEIRAAAGRDFYSYFEAWLDRIAVEPVDGLLCDLMEAEVQGLRLTREEILDICFLLIIAGLDTVTDSLCCFFVYLAKHEEQRRRIVEDPAIIPAAIEELLRWESPVSGIARVATEDTDLGGCPVHKGDSLLVFVGAANTDEALMDHAGSVDFERSENRHRAFGAGVHRCLGSHLARMELRVAMTEWHRRLPEYRIAEGADLVWTPMLRAVEHLPLVFGR